MFSVVIPLYNKELSITGTVQSVLGQTFTDCEIIVVNDGSTDGSLQAVEAIKDSKIRIINKPNGGVSSARNRGIEEARFEWIAFLDGDDLWEVDHLETIQRMILEYPNDSVFCTSFVRSNQQFPVKKNSNIVVVEDYFKEAIKGHFYWTSVSCINCSVFEEVGNFNEKYNRGEDLDLWARIGRKYRFIKSNRITATYRIEAENRSNQSFALEKSRVFNYEFNDAVSDSETLYQKQQAINTLKSLLKSRDMKGFFKLKKKYNSLIRYIDLFK